MTGKDLVSGSDSNLYTMNNSCSCANANLSTKSCAKIKWDCHCSITKYFHYWWSSYYTLKRQT